MGFHRNRNSREQFIPEQKRKILPSTAPASPATTPLTWRVRQYVNNDGASYEPLIADMTTDSDVDYHAEADRGYISDNDHAQYTHKFYTVRIKADQAGPVPIQIYWAKNLSIVTVIGGVTTVEYTTGTEDNVATSFTVELSLGINELHILTYAGVADQRLEITLDLASIHSSMVPVSAEGVGGVVFREVATGNIFGPASAGNDAVTGDYNFAAGVGAMDAVTTSSHNIAIGNNALGAMTGIAGSGENIAIGREAMAGWLGTDNGSGWNIAIGRSALSSLIGVDEASEDNIVIGRYAAQNVIGEYGIWGMQNNVVVGAWALSGDEPEIHDYNVIMGAWAAWGDNPEIGDYNVLLGGYVAGEVVTLGDYNVGIGWYVFGGADGYGHGNYAVGDQCFQFLDSGDHNVAMGENSLSDVTTGEENTGIGAVVMTRVNTGNYNTGLGGFALNMLAGAYEYNTALGYGAGSEVDIGDENTFVGAYAGINFDGDCNRNIVIGYNVGPTGNTALDDQLWIDNHNTDTPFIEGDMAAHTFHINGTLSKTAGAFKIDHPLDETKYLYHGFVESPEYGLIYRGEMQLENGVAVINIDDACGMRNGTFVALVQKTTVYLQSMSGFAAVRPSSVVNGEFSIMCQDASSNDTVSWMVCGERKDEFVMESAETDDEGHLILERDKPARKLNQEKLSHETIRERSRVEHEQRRAKRKEKHDEKMKQRKLKQAQDLQRHRKGL